MKEILNKYTDLCIRKKDRGKEIRKTIERRMMDSRYPEFRADDVLIEDEKTMEDMLKMYMKTEEIFNELIKAVHSYINQGSMNNSIMKDILQAIEKELYEKV